MTTQVNETTMPGVAIVEVKACKCTRCEHVWLPRDWDNLAKVCPKCKSPYWNSERKFPKPEPRKATAKRASAKRTT